MVKQLLCSEIFLSNALAKVRVNYLCRNRDRHLSIYS